MALGSIGHCLSSPLPAIVLMRSAVRHAIACIVRDGFTPPTVGKTEPSQIHRLGISQLRQFVSITLVRGSSPIRAVPFKWHVSRAGGPPWARHRQNVAAHELRDLEAESDAASLSAVVVRGARGTRIDAVPLITATPKG